MATATEKIINWFEDHEDIFVDCIEELDSWNGYLADDRYYTMDELDEIYHDEDASEILRRAFYGYDEESWHKDNNGNKVYEQFNPNRDFFRFNGYGNLVSADYKDYSAHLGRYFVEALVENRSNLSTVDLFDDLSELLDQYEEEND